MVFLRVWDISWAGRKAAQAGQARINLLGALLDVEASFSAAHKDPVFDFRAQTSF